MSNPALLARYAIPGHLSLRTGANGLAFADIDNAHGTASLCMQGGHLMSWRPKDGAEPVVWLSPVATFVPGKSIRGGAPVCWPWFGPHATESGWPSHGFARTVPWELADTAALSDGSTSIGLTLMPTEGTRAQWPHEARLSLKVTVGSRLRIELTTHNPGPQDVVLGEALHTYLRISDIGAVEVQGLDACEFVDKVAGGARKVQRGAVRFAGEVDRVYLNTSTDCVIVDPGLKRRIEIAKTGSRATVVWTPWVEKADKMGDFGPGRDGQGGWREVVCVESANALDNVVSVPAGGSHTLSVSYAALPL